MMSDNELKSNLVSSDLFLQSEGYPEDGLARHWLREAIRRLTPAPMPEGSVEAEIAIAISSDTRVYVEAADVSGSVAASLNARYNADKFNRYTTHQCIARVVVPPVAAVPVVRGEVTG